MTTPSAQGLAAKRCSACEGNVDRIPPDKAQAHLENLPGWHLTHDGNRIRKDWTVRNFAAGVDFLNRVAALAEDEGHHPDLHLEGYRNLWIGLWTHAIGGLSESDFILAAKIDQLPVECRK